MSNSRVLFRVDASIVIGTGHFFRCLSLAIEFIDNGLTVCFISHELPSNLEKILKCYGIELISISKHAQDERICGPFNHSNWLKWSQEDDANLCLEALQGRIWDWLVVDHYSLGRKWESALRLAARNLMVIDDLADREHDCNILVDQNFSSIEIDRYIGKVNPGCKLLLGPKYTIIRKEFVDLHKLAKIRVESVKSILIFFGGVDQQNFTCRTLKVLQLLDFKFSTVNVVAGSLNPNLVEINNICTAFGYQLHVDTNDMASLMMSADMSIGAGGTSLWERCALGLPTIVLCAADNQIFQIKETAAEGLIYCPDILGNLEHSLSAHIVALIENANLRKLLSKKCLEFIDGKGANRVVHNAIEKKIELRRVAIEDAKKIYDWRNDPGIRASSISKGEISYEEHLVWLISKMLSQFNDILIGTIKGSDVGVVRLDYLEAVAIVSIYVAPKLKGNQIGSALLASIEDWLNINRPEIRELQAEVLCENSISKKLFEKSAYIANSVLYKKRMK